jgi:hypothetical protein
MQTMQDLVIAWIESDGTRCVLSGDDVSLALRVILADGRVAHCESVVDVLKALHVRAVELRTPPDAIGWRSQE